MKKIICVMVLLAIMIMPVASYAATPELIGTTYTGNTDELFDILNPDSFSTTTTISTCIVTAAAQPNSKMAIYLFDETTQLYRKITTYFGGIRLEEATVLIKLWYMQKTEIKSRLLRLKLL